MNRNYLIFGASAVLILIIVLSLIFFDNRGFLSGTSKISPSPVVTTTPLNSPEAKNAEASSLPTAQPGIKDFVFTASNFSFSLAEIKVKKGDTVRIVLQNREGFHDFKVDELNVSSRRLQAGEEQMIEFVADKAGVFEFYCSVDGHRQLGMRGSLVVAE